MESMNLRIHTYNDCKEDPDCSMNLSITDNVTTPINYKYFFWTLHRSMSRNNVMDRGTSISFLKLRHGVRALWYCKTSGGVHDEKLLG